jgi:membrane-bound metal-dependent hydrolase YbcI (DUF457 family)
MPFTPFHFGPSGFVGLAFRKWIGLPVFVLANVVIDLEPGIVLLFGLDYPAHGLCHTFLVGAGVGVVWAFAAFWSRGLIGRLMRLFGLGYETNLRKVLVSAVLGVWFHVLLDSFCWPDVQPFWPLHANPFLSLATIKTVYLLCSISFVPAIGLYILAVVSRRKEARGRLRKSEIRN